MNRVVVVVVVMAVSVLGAGIQAHAGTPEDQPTPFDRGRFGLAAGAGRQSAFNQSYFSAGIGAGYFVLDGLEVGLFVLHAFGGPPSIDQLSPSIRYVAHPLAHWPVIPYTGAFYKHWFIGNPYSDVDAIGARAGLLRVQGRVIVGLGAAYDHILSGCSSRCDSVYPDVTLAFTF